VLVAFDISHEFHILLFHSFVVIIEEIFLCS